MSSPSAGKTTLSKKIQQKHKNFKISVSHTTRKPRSNEVEGVDYFLLVKENSKKELKMTNFMNMQKFSIIIMERQKNIDDLRKKITIFCLILIGAHSNFQNIKN